MPVVNSGRFSVGGAGTTRKLRAQLAGGEGTRAACKWTLRQNVPEMENYPRRGGVSVIQQVDCAPELAGDDKLRIRLKAMKAKEAEGERQSVIGSPHFSITSRIGEHESLAEKSLSILEAALSELEDLGISAPEAPLEVFLYPDETYDSAISYGPRWSTGLFDGKLRIRVPGNIENIGLEGYPDQPSYEG